MLRAVCSFLAHFHRFWPMVSGCLIVLAPLSARVQSSSLPTCPKQDGYFLTASPWYAQDQTLFLSDIYPGAIWRSDDAGITWTGIVDMSRYDGFRFGPVTIVPVESASGFQLYHDWTYLPGIFVTARLLWYSADSGATWLARIPSHGEAHNDMYPTNDPGTLFAREPSSPWWPSSGLWRTTNGARSWVEVWDGTEAGWLAISPGFSQDHTLFASLSSVSSTQGSPVIDSTDGGETWQGAGGDDLCDEAAGSVQISSGFTQDRTLFVHQASSLFESQDAGETWSVVFPPDRPHCQPGVVAPTVDSYKLSSTFGQDHTLYAVTTGTSNDHRLLVSGDGGATWTFQSNVSRSTSLLWVLPAAARSNAGEEIQANARSPLPKALEDVGWSPGTSRATVPDNNWTIFLPRVDWTAAQPEARPFTLFIRARNEMDESTYYRSDDGGVTWACMQLPTVQSPFRTTYLGRGR